MTASEHNSENYKRVDLNAAGTLFRYRLCLLGDPGCGKTTILNQFMKGSLPKNDKPTIATDFAERSIPIKQGGTVKIMAWDTPGDTRSRNATLSCCTRMSGVFFFFDPTVRTSFLHIARWFDDVKASIDSDCYQFLIAVKRDVVENQPDLCLTSDEEAKEFADAHGMEYYSINAKNLDDVNRLMERLLDEMHGYKGSGNIDWDTSSFGKRIKPKKLSNVGTAEKVTPNDCCCFLFKK